MIILCLPMERPSVHWARIPHLVFCNHSVSNNMDASFIWDGWMDDECVPHIGLPRLDMLLQFHNWSCVVFKKKYLKDNLRAAFFQTIWAALKHLFGIHTAHNPQNLIKETPGTDEKQKAPKWPNNQHTHLPSLQQQQKNPRSTRPPKFFPLQRQQCMHNHIIRTAEFPN